jgi:chemotaxis signal transduction protein
MEVLVVQTGGMWLAVRASRVGRLRRYNPADLIKSEMAPVPGFMGFIGSLGLPLLNLATLLQLEDNNLGSEAQVLVVDQLGFTAGFVVEVAQEIERAELQALRLLPPLIEQLSLRPAVWALWQRTPDAIIPLLEPLNVLNEAEWQLLVKAQNSDSLIQPE